MYDPKEEILAIKVLLEQHKLESERRFTQLEHDMILMHENRIQSRRQDDDTRKMIAEIKDTLVDIEQKLFGYKNTALAIWKTTIYVTMFFSAIGAAVWAIVTEAFKLAK